MVRVGLVGLGDAGRHHARALAALEAAGRVAWAAIAARDEDKVARFRADAGVPAHVASFASLDALLASRTCDAVVLAVPDGLHAEQVTACAARGHHVLVEKPLALSVDDG
jgi:predicted dehydrogenase